MQNKSPLILLIDTYDTLKSGIKNAIEAFKENNIDNNYPIFGIRLDSGDLAYLSKKVRAQLDENNLTSAKIFLTNSLDEYAIQSLIDQGAQFDMVGVGDAIATSRDNPCFGGVYKLVQINDEPVIKVSEDLIKTLNPSRKNVYRIYNLQNEAMADLITLATNDKDQDNLLQNNDLIIRSELNNLLKTKFEIGQYKIKNLLKTMIRDGIITDEAKKLCNLNYSQSYYYDSLSTFSNECKRLTNPHKYKVDLSKDLLKLKQKMMCEIKGDKE